MNTMIRKGYGRIYTPGPDVIPVIDSIIKEMDEFEHGYLPKGFITTFDHYPEVIYTHKFDSLDMDALTITCWDRGIWIWVYSAGNEQFSDNKILEKS